MAITYPITLPTSPGPAQMEWGALTVAGRNVSPYTLSGEDFEWPGNRWRVSVRYPLMNRTEGDALVAALVSLYGAGTMLLGPAGAGKTAKGAASGTPLVNGASQAGKTLVTDGWTISITGILKAGDFIQLSSGSTSRLHMTLKDVNSDGAGNATLDLWPRLRESPADNSAIVVASPKGLFHLITPQSKWDLDVAYLYGLTFDAEEDL
jgi:hypothetical protein